MVSRNWTRLQDKVSSLTLVLSILVLVAALLIAWYYLRHGTQARDELVFEGVKYLIQLILIVVLGGLLVQRYNSDRTRAEAIIRFRKDTLAALTRAYNDTKKVRRILKASTVLKKESEEDIYEIPRVIYEEQIHKLMDTQLEFEFYEKQLEASDDAFTNTKAIRYQLEKLEEYLKKIIDEYDSKQGAYKKLSRDTSGVPTKALRRLDGFLSGKEFNADFAKIFSSTAKDIQKEILKNQT